MRYTLALLVLFIGSASAVMAQNIPFNPHTQTGNLGSVDAGAIMNYYTNPSVPNTYEFIDPKDVGLPKENAKDVINVEKMDVFGHIKVNPENTEEGAQ